MLSQPSVLLLSFLDTMDALSFFCTASEDNVSSSLVVDRLTPRPKVPETMVGATGARAKVKELGQELDFRLKSIFITNHSSLINSEHLHSTPSRYLLTGRDQPGRHFDTF